MLQKRGGGAIYACFLQLVFINIGYVPYGCNERVEVAKVTLINLKEEYKTSRLGHL